ncbi:unnamed protein product [Closterium sp. NIES-53]
MKMPEYLRRAEEDGEDPTTLFLERLRKQFPGHTAQRIREFQEFRRGNTESLLTYYGRLMNLAEDVVCTDGSMLISKFMGGLDEGLSGGLRMRVYELGADATLEEVFELAEKVESAQRRNEVYLPRVAERKRATWAVAMTHGDEGREEQRQEGRPDTRTCHRCGQKGHIRINCRNYDVCGKHGHRRSDCPEKSVEEIENQLGRLRAQLQALKGKEETGWYTREEEEEEEKQEPECSYAVLRVREDMRLRSGGRDGRGECVRKVGAWACIPATPKTEGKEEKVGAGVCVLVAADMEERDEQVGAEECVPTVAEAEGKNEKVGLQACTPATVEAEGKEEKMGIKACKSEVAEAVGKNEELGAWAGAPAAAEAEGKNEEVRVRAGVSAEMTSNWWQGELGIAGWEGPVWDTAQEREEAERKSKEVGAREWGQGSGGKGVGAREWGQGSACQQGKKWAILGERLRTGWPGREPRQQAT